MVIGVIRLVSLRYKLLGGNGALCFERVQTGSWTGSRRWVVLHGLHGVHGLHGLTWVGMG